MVRSTSRNSILYRRAKVAQVEKRLVPVVGGNDRNNNGGSTKCASLGATITTSDSQQHGQSLRGSKRRSLDLSRVPDKRQEWKIHVRTHSDRVLTVVVHPYDSIEDVRMKVAMKEDCSSDQVILLLEGHVLQDGYSLNDWNICDGTMLFMAFRLRGG